MKFEVMVYLQLQASEQQPQTYPALKVDTNFIHSTLVVCVLSEYHLVVLLQMYKRVCVDNVFSIKS